VGWRSGAHAVGFSGSGCGGVPRSWTVMRGRGTGGM
jgi:hypothetical protein